MQDSSENEDCDVCGEKHDTNNCPLVNLVNRIEDQTVPSHARLSLPSNLYVKNVTVDKVSVFVKEVIPKGVQFGPFEAPLTSAVGSNIRFQLKLFRKDGSFNFLNTSDEKDCNWMCLISPAHDESDQNLIAYQLNDSIYFAAQCQIEPDEELKVGYAAGYARKMNLPSKKKGGIEEITNHDIQTDEDFMSSVGVVVRNLPASVLGAKKDILEQEHSEWACSQCNDVFDNCIDFGHHLQDHVRPIMQLEKSTTSPRKQNNVERSSIISDMKDSPNEMHVIISTADAQKYNLRRNRKKSRAILEQEETSALKKRLKLKPSRSSNEQSSLNVGDNINDLVKDDNCDVQKNNELPALGNVMDVALDDNETDTNSSNQSEGEELEPSVITVVTVGSDEISLPVPERTKFKCDICHKAFSMSKYLYRHIKKHTGDFTCSQCHKVFARKESLQSHSCKALIAEGSDFMLEYSCAMCDKSFGTEKFLERHLVKHTGEIKCTDCGKYYNTQNSYETHECSAKLGNLYECNICLKKFSQKVYLMKHLPIHTDQHKCPTCDKTLRSNESLQNHVRVCGRVHEIETNGKVSCETCSEEFTDAKLFRRHIYEHSHSHVCDKCGARFRNSVTLGLHVCSPDTCKECGKKFNGADKLEKHLLSSCGSQYTCDKCLRPFQNEELMVEHNCPGFPDMESELFKSKSRRHIRKGTVDKSTLICEFCGSLFSSVSSLNVHRSLHGEKKFSCKECGKKFHRKDLMLEHESVHSEATIECKICHKMLKTKKSLEVHMLIHRGVKKFKCEECGKEFFQKGNLQKHLETHNPERKHECYACEKAFSTKEYLKIHQLEHSQGKIHNCCICGRSFLKSHQLKNHQKLFHSNQSFVCRYCGLTLKLRHSLKRHLEKKHAYVKNEWDSPEVLSSMAITNDESTEQPISNYVPNPKLDMAITEGNAEDEAKNSADVLLAVAGLGNEALERAIAEGKAHVRQGIIPNTIEISLPFGLEGEELTRSLVQNSNQIEEVNAQLETDDANEEGAAGEQALKLFTFQSASPCYTESAETIIDANYVAKDDQSCHDLGSKLVINTSGQSDEANANTEAMIVKLSDEHGSQIIINQPSGDATESQDLSLTDEGQVLLYVVADEMEEV